MVYTLCYLRGGSSKHISAVVCQSRRTLRPWWGLPACRSHAMVCRESPVGLVCLATCTWCWVETCLVWCTQTPGWPLHCYHEPGHHAWDQPGPSLHSVGSCTWDHRHSSQLSNTSGISLSCICCADQHFSSPVTWVYIKCLLAFEQSRIPTWDPWANWHKSPYRQWPFSLKFLHISVLNLAFSPLVSSSSDLSLANNSGVDLHKMHYYNSC